MQSAKDKVLQVQSAKDKVLQKQALHSPAPPCIAPVPSEQEGRAVCVPYLKAHRAF